jgi:hypothetical protein
MGGKLFTDKLVFRWLEGYCEKCKVSSALLDVSFTLG